MKVDNAAILKSPRAIAVLAVRFGPQNLAGRRSTIARGRWRCGNLFCLTFVEPYVGGLVWTLSTLATLGMRFVDGFLPVTIPSQPNGTVARVEHGPVSRSLGGS
ncbi:hypothetical protein RVY79_17830, partial [Chromohalobacter sp. HP20-39]|nr:hypothetical protein [Chromohalobacter sp. HP20-39]